MNILYKIVKQQKSTDNGRTWIDTGNKKVGGILEYDSDCAVSSDDTLSFEFSGTTTTYKLNGTTYTATSSPYSTTLDELGINTLTGCNYAFSDTSITKLISFPDTSNVTTMIWMFASCESLTSLDLSSFNTSNVTDMNRMFSSCKNLTSLDLSSFNTSKMTKMRHMFYNCSGLTSLNLSSFNTSNVTDMEGMFYKCKSLTSLDLSSFNTSNVTDMDYMFYDCTNLTTLDLSSWDVGEHITSYTRMFEYCTSLQTLKVKQGTYNWWCARLSNAGISCDIIEEVNTLNV